LENPLFEDLNKKGADRILINICGSGDLKMEDIETIATKIGENAARNALIIYGSSNDNSMKDRVRVSFVMTGLEGSMLKKVKNVGDTIWDFLRKVW